MSHCPPNIPFKDAEGTKSEGRFFGYLQALFLTGFVDEEV